MIVTLEKTKEWLRVESTDDDALIESFILAAEEIVQGVLRFPFTDLETMPEEIKQAVWYTVSQLYELRESFDITALLSTLKHLLYEFRKDAW